MGRERSCRSNTYRIRVGETLDNHILDWYSDLTILPQANGMTTLIGHFTDQPALRGFLEHLWNLNITVISVDRMENEN